MQRMKYCTIHNYYVQAVYRVTYYAYVMKHASASEFYRFVIKTTTSEKQAQLLVL